MGVIAHMAKRYTHSVSLVKMDRQIVIEEARTEGWKPASRRYLHPIPLPLLTNQDNLDGLLVFSDCVLR
jgi:hypothetical protein